MKPKIGTKEICIGTVDPEIYAHRQMVIERKRQIELQKLDSALPERPAVPLPKFEKVKHPYPKHLLRILFRELRP